MLTTRTNTTRGQCAPDPRVGVEEVRAVDERIRRQSGEGPVGNGSLDLVPVVETNRRGLHLREEAAHAVGDDDNWAMSWIRLIHLRQLLAVAGRFHQRPLFAERRTVVNFAAAAL